MDIYEAERKWGDALRGQSLVIQIEYDDDVARQALKRIGYLIQRGDAFAVESSHMASLLVGLNLVASAELEHGALWMKIMAALNNLENSQGNQQKITRLHRLALKKFGLQRFEHPLGRIGEIILHAGIPVHSQKTFIQRLIREYRNVSAFDAAYFCSEVRALPRERIQSKGLDAPTWHFINQAGDVAEDFVAKCIEVLDDLQDDGVLNSGGGQGLPQRIINEIERIVTELGSLQRVQGSARLMNPKVHWLDDEICIALPVMPENGSSETTWHIETSSHATSLTIPRTMPGLAAAKENFSIHEVTPTVALRASVSKFPHIRPFTRSWNLRLFGESAPVLIFKPDGTVDTSKGPAEPALHRILMPQNYKGVESRVEIDGVAKFRQVDTPFGWGSSEGQSNWVAFEVDLDGADLLSIYLGDNQRPAVKRSISAFKKPQIFQTSVAAGIYDLDGNPIHSSLPIISVPPSETGQELWTYRLANINDGSATEKLVAPESGLLKPIFEAEIDGIYEISVSRGFGTGLKFTANVVSGLKNASSALRRMGDDGAGLLEYSTHLERAGFSQPYILDSASMEIAIDNPKLSAQSLVLSPAHECFELLNSKSIRSSTWVTPIKAHIEDLIDLQLYVSLDETGSSKLLGQSSDNTVIQLNPKDSSPKSRFSLSELAETANQKGALNLYLLTPSGRKLSLGQVYPKKLFTAVEFDLENRLLSLSFPSKIIPPGLEICFYTTLSPWLKPIVVAVDGNHAVVPESIMSFGEIFFTVGIENPWISKAFPDSPELSNPNTSSFDSQPIDSALSADHALAFWLKTGQKTPNLSSLSVSRAWQCLLEPNMTTRQSTNRTSVRDFAAGILNQNSAVALDQYPHDGVNQDHYLKHLFATGLVASNSIDSTRGVNEFAGRPFLACLLTSEANAELYESLISLASDFWGLRANISESEVEPETAQPEDLAQTLLSKSKLFEQMPMLFDFYNDLELENWFENYVPGALFESGTMAKIARDLALSADKAHEILDSQALRAAVAELANDSELSASAAITLAGTRPFAPKALRDRVRNGKGLRIVTFDLPAISIRLAILVRLGARGDQMALDKWGAYMYLHKQISTVSPALVEFDLSLAELYLKIRESAANG